MTARVALRALIAFAVFLLCATGALAQRGPYGDDRRGPDDGDARGNEAGRFDYYILSLSWSPTYCAGLPRGANDPQCDRRRPRPYAFVLHGLWPQFERGRPESCPSRDRGFVPRPVAQRMLDIMPSDRLVFHEYRKHGTCTGLGVDGYFALSRSLYEKIKIPQRYVEPVDERLIVAPDELVQEFMAVNPGLRPDMVAVACGGPGNRLRDVRICFDKSGRPRPCGESVVQRKLCAAQRIFVPPVRQGGPGRDPAERDSPLPGPRLPPPGQRAL